MYEYICSKQELMKPENELLLGNGYVTSNNGETIGNGVFCAVRAEAM
jgi:hypothetical protein